MLKQRIITALILLPIALGGFFLLEGSGFALFIGLVVSLGAWEWARLAGFTAQTFRVGYAAVVALMLFVMYILPGLAPWVLGASVIWWALATWLVLTYPRSSERWSSAASTSGPKPPACPSFGVSFLLIAPNLVSIHCSPLMRTDS